MIHIPNIEGQTYGVVGLGKSGRATVASVLASGAQVFAWDDNEASRAAAQIEFPSINIAPIAQWNSVALNALVMSPGILLTHPAVLLATQHNIEIIGDIELLYRSQPAARYIAITGTNGKSTTTSLIAHILQACGKRVEMGGNIGIPALALAPLDADGIYVLELSSYQLDLIRSTKFHIAILLNMTPDHLDHHGSMEAYIEAKRHIFDRQETGDVAIVGIDDAISEAIGHSILSTKKQRLIPISVLHKTVEGIAVHGGMLTATFGGAELHGDLNAIRSLQGDHNGQNAAAAYAACVMSGCTHDEILAAMASYPGLAHRMEWLGAINGVQFVNDSKATNADAAEKALKTYDAIYWIAGGVAKEGGIESLSHYFQKIRHAYLIGEATDMFVETLDGNVPYTRCETLEKAFHAATNAAQQNLQEKPVVMLSPACASFDQFANFEVRGQAFVALVDQWKKGVPHAPTA